LPHTEATIKKTSKLPLFEHTTKHIPLMVEQALVALVVTDNWAGEDCRKVEVDYMMVGVGYTMVEQVEYRTLEVDGYNLYKHSMNK